MIWQKNFLLILFSFVGFVNVIAQNLQPSFRHYTVDDGLPSSEIYDILQDSRGYMWFATDRGVSRFNGYGFENFSSKDGLTDNTVFLLYEDHQDRIWFTTYSGQLFYFKNDSIYTYRYNSKVINSIEKNQIIFSFHVDESETIHLGLRGKGWIQIDSLGAVTYVLPKKPEAQVFMLIENTPFCFSYMGNRDTLNFEIWDEEISESHVFEINSNLRGNHISGLKRKNGSYIIGVGSIMLKRSAAGVVKFNTKEKEIISLKEDSKEFLWVGYYKGGVDCENKNGVFFKLLNRRSVSCVYEDKEGGMWLSTLEDGVYYLTSMAFSTLSTIPGIIGTRASKVTGDGLNRIYAGYDNGIVADVNGDLQIQLITSDLLNADSSATVTGLFFDGQNEEVWVGSRAGCWTFKKDGQINTVPPFRFGANGFSKSPNGKIRIGT